MMLPMSKIAVSVGALAFLALGSSTASALSSWDFTGDQNGTNLGFTEDFIAGDGSVLTARGFSMPGIADTAGLVLPVNIHQNDRGIGVGFGNGNGQLEAFPNSHVGATPGLCFFFGCIIPPTPAFELETAFADVIRLDFGADNWFAKDITIEQFGAGEFVQVFGGNSNDGSDAVLLNTLEGVAGSPDFFSLDDSDPFGFIFIAALATVEDCPAGTGLCGSSSRLRIAGFSGTQVPEPGALALLGIGVFGFAVARRRRLAAA